MISLPDVEAFRPDAERVRRDAGTAHSDDRAVRRDVGTAHPGGEEVRRDAVDDFPAACQRLYVNRRAVVFLCYRGSAGMAPRGPFCP